MSRLCRGIKCRNVFDQFQHRWRDPRACRSASMCRFSHNQLEFLFHPSNYKRFRCSNLNATGQCIFQQNCAFRHGKGKKIFTIHLIIFSTVTLITLFSLNEWAACLFFNRIKIYSLYLQTVLQYDPKELTEMKDESEILMIVKA